MRPTARLVVLCLSASVALLAISAAAGARPKPISGKLSKPGYTVIALAANGEATAERAKRGRFRLRPPANRVSLHLRRPDGTYAGPIVVGRASKGKRAIVGVRGGAELGRVKVNVRKGFARVSRRLPRRSMDREWLARARRGVPIGAGVFGRVRSKPSRAKVPADRERDGIPDALDVDDDGDLVLDNMDSSGRKGAVARAGQVTQNFIVQSSMALALHQTVNANAAALTTAQIDAALSSEGILSIQHMPGDVAELDCGHPTKGLVYCRKQNSTGRPRADPAAFPQYWDGNPAEPAKPPFPSCCDPDNDGFGSFVQFPGAPTPTMILGHGATSAQIGTGDVLIERVTTGGVETKRPATINFVFATVHALVSYDDGQGNAATVPYPFPGGAFMSAQGFPVHAGPSGDVVVTLTFWRPQRRPIPPEAAEWIDIGGLGYVAGRCPQSAYSITDPGLTPFPTFPDAGGFKDLVPDRPADPSNTFTFTLNLSECFRADGRSFDLGDTRVLTITAATVHGDLTAQTVAFKRQ